MLQYVPSPNGSCPVKKFPYVESAPEWSCLATYTQEIEPTNYIRKNIIRGPDWIKTQWCEICKSLHQMFLQYNRSGQHDPEMDEWGSDKECRQWARAASWRAPGTNSSVCFQQAMVYSIALLDQCNFESIGHKLPKGIAIDALLADGTLAPKHKPKKRVRSKVEKEILNNKKASKGIITAIELGSKRETKLSALCLILEFGDEAEKSKARRELHALAYGSKLGNNRRRPIA